VGRITEKAKTITSKGNPETKEKRMTSSTSRTKKGKKTEKKEEPELAKTKHPKRSIEMFVNDVDDHGNRTNKLRAVGRAKAGGGLKRGSPLIPQIE